MNKTFDIFVPGRLCILGEHSDWAGACRKDDPTVEPGQVIVCGINQGIRAKVRAVKDEIRITSTKPDGEKVSETLPLDTRELRRIASEGGFFSYAAGVAAHILEYHNAGGLEIHNYETTLPIQKGLSSSAAFCVLMARAFNLAYDLKLSVRGEMEAAYMGETMTPSQCGRMDQCCAYGREAVEMTFDGDLVTTRKLNIPSPVYFLVAALKGFKDTKKILSDLNTTFETKPAHGCENFSPVHILRDGIRHYLGKVNRGIIANAAEALTKGDAKALGALMDKAQEAFDLFMRPASPEQLEAPILHKVLAEPYVRKRIYGGKGVGSQGDGSVQMVAKSQQERNELADFLSKNYDCQCFMVDLGTELETASAPPSGRNPKGVFKALIPAAGLGTRMFPATKSVKKEMLPVVTPDGVCKPILQTILEEAVDAGIEDIAIIVRPEDEAIIAGFLSPADPAFFARLPEKAKNEQLKLEEIGRKVVFIRQEEQLGFGHAVSLAQKWAGNDPVLLLLGDHIYSSNTRQNCASQLIEAFEKHGRQCIVSLYTAPGASVHHYGTATGTWVDDECKTLKLSMFAEKPTLEFARANLAMPGLPDDSFLCVYGQYILTPELFKILADQISRGVKQKGEFQLTTALDELRATSGMLGFLVNGAHYDTGQPGEYLESLKDYYAKIVE